MKKIGLDILRNTEIRRYLKCFKTMRYNESQNYRKHLMIKTLTQYQSESPFKFARSK